jgi:glycosyltransferase involved in cell wall biosynthesis
LAFIAFGFAVGVLGASSIGAPVRGALTHMAIYLTISALLCLLPLFTPMERARPICRVLKNETNRGLLYSINRALNEARCDFIVWAAADDRLMPNFVERNVQCLLDYPTTGMTFSHLAVFRDDLDDIIPFTKRSHGAAFDFGTTPLFLSPEALRNRLQHSYLWNACCLISTTTQDEAYVRLPDSRTSLRGERTSPLTTT